MATVSFECFFFPEAWDSTSAKLAFGCEMAKEMTKEFEQKGCFGDERLLISGETMFSHRP